MVLVGRLTQTLRWTASLYSKSIITILIIYEEINSLKLTCLDTLGNMIPIFFLKRNNVNM